MLASIAFDLAADIACALLVLLRFRYLSLNYRVLGLYEILTAAVNTAGLILVKLKLSNVLLFSVYAIASFCLLQYFCYRKLERKRLIVAALILVVLFWISESVQGGIYYFPLYFLLLQSIILIAVFFLLLYQSALKTDESLKRNPDFFTGLAVIIFYGCMTHQLIFNINSPSLSLTKDEIELLGIPTRIYSNAKALLLFTAFLLEIKRNKRNIA